MSTSIEVYHLPTKGTLTLITRRMRFATKRGDLDCFPGDALFTPADDIEDQHVIAPERLMLLYGTEHPEGFSAFMKFWDKHEIAY